MNCDELFLSLGQPASVTSTPNSHRRGVGVRQASNNAERRLYRQDMAIQSQNDLCLSGNEENLDAKSLTGAG